MLVKIPMNAVVFAIVLVFGLTGAPIIAQAVCVDNPCPPTATHSPAPANHPSYRGAFSLDNSTGTTMHYQVKWGNGQWKSQTLQSGMTTTHWYPLDDADRAPTPYVRFDRIGGDNAYTEQEYEMDFYKVGPGRPDAKGYVFRYASDGKHLDIKAK
jgi:hypothetical protein